MQSLASSIVKRIARIRLGISMLELYDSSNLTLIRVLNIELDRLRANLHHGLVRIDQEGFHLLLDIISEFNKNHHSAWALVMSRVCYLVGEASPSMNSLDYKHQSIIRSLFSFLHYPEMLQHAVYPLEEILVRQSEPLSTHSIQGFMQLLESATPKNLCVLTRIMCILLRYYTDQLEPYDYFLQVPQLPEKLVSLLQLASHLSPYTETIEDLRGFGDLPSFYHDDEWDFLHELFESIPSVWSTLVEPPVLSPDIDIDELCNALHTRNMATVPASLPWSSMIQIVSKLQRRSSSTYPPPSQVILRKFQSAYSGSTVDAMTELKYRAMTIFPHLPSLFNVVFLLMNTPLTFSSMTIRKRFLDAGILSILDHLFRLGGTYTEYPYTGKDFIHDCRMNYFTLINSLLFREGEEVEQRNHPLIQKIMQHYIRDVEMVSMDYHCMMLSCIDIYLRRDERLLMEHDHTIEIPDGFLEALLRDVTLQNNHDDLVERAFDSLSYFFVRRLSSIDPSIVDQLMDIAQNKLLQSVVFLKSILLYYYRFPHVTISNRRVLSFLHDTKYEFLPTLLHECGDPASVDIHRLCVINYLLTCAMIAMDRGQLPQLLSMLAYRHSLGIVFSVLTFWKSIYHEDGRIDGIEFMSGLPIHKWISVCDSFLRSLETIHYPSPRNSILGPRFYLTVKVTPYTFYHLTTMNRCAFHFMRMLNVPPSITIRHKRRRVLTLTKQFV